MLQRSLEGCRKRLKVSRRGFDCLLDDWQQRKGLECWQRLGRMKKWYDEKPEHLSSLKIDYLLV